MKKYLDNTTGKVVELLIGTVPNYVVLDNESHIVGIFSQTGLQQRFSPVEEDEDEH